MVFGLARHAARLSGAVAGVQALISPAWARLLLGLSDPFWRGERRRAPNPAHPRPAWRRTPPVSRPRISLETGKTKRRVVLPIAKPLLSFLRTSKPEKSKPLFPHACDIYEKNRFDGRLSGT